MTENVHQIELVWRRNPATPVDAQRSRSVTLRLARARQAGHIGVLAIEFFLDGDAQGQALVLIETPLVFTTWSLDHEPARPISSRTTSAVADSPGDQYAHKRAAMVNLIGVAPLSAALFQVCGACTCISTARTRVRAANSGTCSRRGLLEAIDPVSALVELEAASQMSAVPCSTAAPQ